MPITIIGYLIAAILLIILISLIAEYNKKKQALEETEAELETSEKRLKKADLMYRESLQAKDSLNLQYEELKTRYEKSNRLAYTDSLTGLPNQEQANGMLESICQTLRTGENFALTQIFVGDRTRGTDMSGRSSKEEMLLDVTQRLKANLSFNEDYLAKTGESSFTLVSQNFDDDNELDRKLGKLFKILCLPFVSGGKEYIPQIYMATAVAPKDGKTVQLLQMNVELALSEARKQEESAFVYFDPAFAERAMERIELQADLRRAVSAGQLEYGCQAVMDLKKGISDTCILTPIWKSQDRGTRYFNDFRENLEECEICMEAYESVFLTACRAEKQLETQGYPTIRIIVPCLTRQVLDETFARRSYELAEAEGADPARLLFMLPYRAVEKQPEHIKDMMLKMKKFGFRFVLDAYAAENVSLNTVMTMPFDQIAISEDLFRGAGQDTESLLPAATAFLHNAGRKTIILGTGYKEQESFLRKAGCDMAVGELYSGVMLPEIYLQFLRLQTKK